ncbi:MAG: TolC family protein [Bacteroidota bacterium]
MTGRALHKIKKAVLPVLFTFSLALGISCADAQQASTPEIKLSLKEAITLAKSQNIAIGVARQEEKAANEDMADARNGMLPSIAVNAGYQRYTKLTLFENGLHNAYSIDRKPSANGASQSTEMAFNLYSGGKNRALIQERQAGKYLAGINSRDQAGNTSLQLVFRYLELVKLFNQRKLITDQSERARTRLKTINALYKNQRITRSDVLRAELVLANVQLDSIHNQNDITIANNKVSVLLHLPDNTHILPADSANMNRPDPEELARLTGSGEQGSYAVQRTGALANIQSARLKGIKGNAMPTATLVSAYGFSYPNYLFFPPVDQLYSIGYIGAKVSYNLSSLYHNKHKVTAAEIRLDEIRQEQQLVQDNTREELKALLIRYNESLNRVAVMRQSIVQAGVNYRIVNTKYFNQLALLTDLLDADNLYQEASYNLISAETEASLIYYNLLYTTGNL